jgi:hypothetical protein
MDRRGEFGGEHFPPQSSEQEEVAKALYTSRDSEKLGVRERLGARAQERERKRERERGFLTINR